MKRAPSIKLDKIFLINFVFVCKNIQIKETKYTVVVLYILNEFGVRIYLYLNVFKYIYMWVYYASEQIVG